MNAHDCITSMELAARAGIALCIQGPPGVGKTSITKQYAQKRAKDGPFFYGVLNAATANLADVTGFLLPHEVPYHTADGKTVTISHGRYTYPYYFMDQDTGKPAFMFEHGTMVVEEYGQATADVKRALATMIHEKRVGDVVLPGGFSIMLLTNRPQDRSGVGKDYDFIINREDIIEFTPELEGWLEWAGDSNVEPVVMAFAARNEEIVFSGKVPEKQGPWCTPRSLVAAGELIRQGETMGLTIDSRVLMDNLRGTVGATAVQLLAFLKLKDSLPKLSDIIADPRTAMVPDKPDGQMVVSFELAHRATKANIDPIVVYMKRLPVPFAVTFMKTMLKKTGALISTKAVGDWTRENHQLLAAIAK